MKPEEQQELLEAVRTLLYRLPKGWRVEAEHGLVRVTKEKGEVTEYRRGKERAT